MIDQILNGISSVFCYLDDVLISRRSLEESEVLVDEVMKRLSRYNVKVNMVKCKFIQSSVEYLGHKVNSVSIHATAEKLRKLQNQRT